MRHRSSARPAVTTVPAVPAIPAVPPIPAVPSIPAVSSIPDGPAVATADRPVNRAERRAAARGRDLAAHAGSTSASRTSGPRSSGPGVQSRPAHTRLDFAARKSG